MRANLKKLQTTFPTSPLFVFTSVQRENSAVLQVGEDWDQVMSKLRAGGPPTLHFNETRFQTRTDKNRQLFQVCIHEELTFETSAIHQIFPMTYIQYQPLFIKSHLHEQKKNSQFFQN